MKAVLWVAARVVLKVVLWVAVMADPWANSQVVYSVAQLAAVKAVLWVAAWAVLKVVLWVAVRVAL